MEVLVLHDGVIFKLRDPLIFACAVPKKFVSNERWLILWRETFAPPALFFTSVCGNIFLVILGARFTKFMNFAFTETEKMSKHKERMPEK